LVRIASRQIFAASLPVHGVSGRRHRAEMRHLVNWSVDQLDQITVIVEQGAHVNVAAGVSGVHIGIDIGCALAAVTVGDPGARKRGRDLGVLAGNGTEASRSLGTIPGGVGVSTTVSAETIPATDICRHGL